jgi:hypothetical protein
LDFEFYFATIITLTMADPNAILTNKEKNICEYGATFGVMLTLTCIIQHFMLTFPGPLTGPMFTGYAFSVIAFILFGFQKHFSVVLLIISGVISLIIECIWITSYVFSLVVLLLFVYHVVIVVVAFMENIPGKLKMKRAAAKAERDLWSGKI